MFEMIGGGERAGSGADTIKKGWADNKWPAPEIKEHFGQNDDRVELTLRLVQSTSSPGKGTESGQKSRLKSGQKIVELMRKNPSITIAELVSELGMSRSGISKQIAKLKADGVIEREGSDKSGQWITKA
jgi:ATP-dependent DNA helicase RecG